MELFNLKAGSIPGKDHLFRQANCQDRYRWKTFVVEGKFYQAGIVCDGCGSADGSEVGAALLAEFGVAELERLILRGVALEEVPGELYQASLHFLKKLACLVLGEKPSPEGTLEFVGRYLLATVVGFVAGEEETLVFAAGDGLIIVNDELDQRDENNRPNYLVYGLLAPEQFTHPMPRRGFDFRLLPTASIERLAVWTDGFDPALSGQIWELGGPRGLQRKLNVWGKAKMFADDTTGITLERRGQEG